MEVVHNTSEQHSQKEKALTTFFENLPESRGEVCAIERQDIERLAEQGVSVEDVCHAFVQRGFLLHGTGLAGLETLEPRQANDEGGYEENLKNAVYAASDPRVSIFMALRWNTTGISEFSINSEHHEDGLNTESTYFATTSDIPSDTIGYVYVLPKDTFEVAGSDSQFVSLVPVHPSYEIPVTINDFQYPIEKIKA